ncbi:MAG TPA: hypothetical protein VJ761_00050 [Ktedonobacteraceae bacterium]|nr:hypothetical protein [Ktedonobacteraceae bacterium]
MTNVILNTSSIEGVELFDLNDNSAWEKLYPVLESLARYFVYSSNIASWKGQERDIIEDIVQETGRRIIERALKATRGEALPIQSLRSMLFVMVHNYCEDLRRHDHRLVRAQPQDASIQVYLDLRNTVNVLESSTESVYQEALFKLVAREVAAFPSKQRSAILIDLANRMHFDIQPTPLQKAFLEVGIDLRQYKQPLPANAQERSKHASLVTWAYKRVASSQQVQKYVAFA